MAVSENSGFSPQIIHLEIGFSIINHPFWGTSIFGNTHIYIYTWNLLGPCVYKWLLQLNDSTTERQAFDVVFFLGGRF